LSRRLLALPFPDSRMNLYGSCPTDSSIPQPNLDKILIQQRARRITMKQPHRMIRLGTRVFYSISGCSGIATQSGVNGQVTGPSATLSWSPSSSAAVGFRVYRSTQSGTAYTLLTSTLVPGTSFVDTTVAKGRTYFYVVTAVDDQFERSGFSNKVFVTIPSS
jgi:hypothetical protein